MSPEDTKKNTVFKVKIPKKNEVDRITISMLILKREFLSEINKKFPRAILGNTSSKLHYHETPERFISVYHNEDLKCFDCLDHILLVNCQGKIVQLTIFLFKSPYNLINYGLPLVDQVSPNKSNTYKVNLPSFKLSETQSLLINVKSLIGQTKDIYANPSFIPKELSKYFWKSELTTNLSYFPSETIEITSKEMKEIELKINSPLFITVRSRYNGFYLLEVEIAEKNVRQIHLGVKESGRIENKEVINYEFKLWEYGNSENYVIHLAVASGNANIYARECELKGLKHVCEPFTAESIKKNKDYQLMSVSDGTKSLSFSPKCFHMASKFCYYSFGIQGNNDFHKHSHYEFYVSHFGFVQSLTPNRLHQSFILDHQFDAYKLDVENNSPGGKIIIAINTHLDIFFTTNQTCVYYFEQCNKKGDMALGNSKHPIIISRSQTAKGSYYIIVGGSKATNYILNPIVLEKGETVDIPLFEGKEIEYFVNKESRTAYFHFLANVNSNYYADDIRINLIGDPKTFTIYVKKNYKNLAGPKNHDWLSRSNSLSFHNKNTKNETIRFSIAVVLSREDTEDLDFRFSIFFSSGEEPIHLESNRPFYGKVGSGGIKIFKTKISPSDNLMFLTKSVIDHKDKQTELKMHVYGDSKDHVFYSGYDKPTIKIDDLNKLCTPQEVKNYKCFLNVILYNRAEYSLYYSLRLRIGNLSIQMIEGQEQTFSLKNIYGKYKSLKLFYYPKTRKAPTDIYIYSQFGKLDCYVNLFNNVGNILSVTWPTIRSRKYSNQIRLYHKESFNKFLFSLHPKFLNGCWPNCLILIEIKSVKNSDFETPYFQKENSFHVTVSSSILALVKSRPVGFSVRQSSYKYFSLRLMNEIGQNATIWITLTSYVGNGIICKTIRKKKFNFNLYKSF